MLCSNGLAQPPVATSALRNTTSGLVSLSLSAPSYSAAQAFMLLFKPICESELPATYGGGGSDSQMIKMEPCVIWHDKMHLTVQRGEQSMTGTEKRKTQWRQGWVGDLIKPFWQTGTRWSLLSPSPACNTYLHLKAPHLSAARFRARRKQWNWYKVLFHIAHVEQSNI